MPPSRLGSRSGLTRDPLLWIVAGLAALVPWIVADPASPRWHGLKTLAVECGAALLLTALLSRPMSGRKLALVADFLRRGPQPFLLALALWAASSYTWSAARPFSALGLVQLLCGLLVYGVVAFRVRSQSGYLLLLAALSVAAVMAGVSGFVGIGQGGAPLATGVFHDHQLFGSLVMLLLPVLLAGSFVAAPVPRYAAQGAAIVCAAALVMSQTRSAWIGEALALTTFAALFLWCWALTAPTDIDDGGTEGAEDAIPFLRPPRRVRVLGFLTMAPQTESLQERFHTLTSSVARGQDLSLNWRFGTWQGARRMFLQRPLWGWGVGCYQPYQHAFTGDGEPTETVLSLGPTISDQAHDSYLQEAVELGAPGLILWVAALAAAIVTGLRALPRLPSGSPRRWVLIGGVSALSAQAVDALANPAWQFSEIALYFWIVMGLTVAAANSGGARDRWSQDGVGVLPTEHTRIAWPLRLYSGPIRRFRGCLACLSGHRERAAAHGASALSLGRKSTLVPMSFRGAFCHNNPCRSFGGVAHEDQQGRHHGGRARPEDLPLQTLVDRDGETKSVLGVLVEEARRAGIEDICVVVHPGDEEAYRAAAGGAGRTAVSCRRTRRAATATPSGAPATSSGTIRSCTWSATMSLSATRPRGAPSSSWRPRRRRTVPPCPACSPRARPSCTASGRSAGTRDHGAPPNSTPSSASARSRRRPRPSSPCWSPACAPGIICAFSVFTSCRGP